MDEMNGYQSTEVIFTIKQVADSVGVSTNTIRNWEREMEDVLVINRDSNKNRYYTFEDIENFKQIDALKGEGMQFSAIRKFFAMLKRSGGRNGPGLQVSNPFQPPANPEPKNVITMEQLEESNRKLLESVMFAFDQRMVKLTEDTKQLNSGEEVSEQFENVSKELKELKKHLTNEKSPEEERRERLEQTLTTRRVESKLKRAAIEKWNLKPESERFKKVSFFRTEEDSIKKEEFIREYIDMHFEEEIKKEYDL